MTVSIEGFVLQNLLMNALILILAARLAGVRAGKLRIGLASALGCGYAVCAYLPGQAAAGTAAAHGGLRRHDAAVVRRAAWAGMETHGARLCLHLDLHGAARRHRRGADVSAGRARLRPAGRVGHGGVGRRSADCADGGAQPKNEQPHGAADGAAGGTAREPCRHCGHGQRAGGAAEQPAGDRGGKGRAFRRCGRQDARCHSPGGRRRRAFCFRTGQRARGRAGGGGLCGGIRRRAQHRRARADSGRCMG